MRVLAFLILLIPAFCYAQPGRPAPMKKDNRIYLVGAQAQEVYKVAKRLLFERGYSIKFNDDEAFILEAGPIKLDKGRVLHITRLSANDTIAVLSAQMDLANAQFGFSETSMRGMKGSFIMKSWEELDRIAHLIAEQTGAQVRYGRE